MAFTAVARQKGRPSYFNRVLAFSAGSGTIRFILSPDLRQWLDVDAGDRITVLVGEGADRGRIAFRKSRDDERGLMAQMVSRQLGINVSATKIGRRAPETSVVLAHRRDEKTKTVVVEIDKLDAVNPYQGK